MMDIFDLEFQHPDYEGCGSEPSLRKIIHEYYKNLDESGSPLVDSMTKWYIEQLKLRGVQ